jgi:hypothetical protein
MRRRSGHGEHALSHQLADAMRNERQVLRERPPSIHYFIMTTGQAITNDDSFSDQVQ